MASNSKFVCMLCSKTFAQRRYLKAHLQRCVASSVAEKKPKPCFRCSECEKTFTKESRLKRHQSHHYQTKGFQCNLCHKSFVQKPHLKRHMQTVHSSEIAVNGEENSSIVNKKCHFCEKLFSTNWQVSRHEKAVHQFATNLYKCRYCGDKFDNQKIYINHLEYHKGLKRHQCQLCGFAFKRTTEFDLHMSARHGHGLVFACVLCQEEFVQRSQLFRHIQTKHEANQLVDMNMEINQPYSLLVNGKPLITCRFCGLKLFCKKSYLSHINDSHYKKIFRTESIAPCNKGISTERNNSNNSKSNEHNVVSPSQNDNDFTWKNLSLKVVFDKNCQPTSRLELGKYLPDKFLSENGSLSTLEIDLLQHVCRPEEIIVIEIPVKVHSTNTDKFPELLTIDYSV